jgi:hypothetical protein
MSEEIPKIIFQTGGEEQQQQQQYVIDLILEKCVGWKYEFFNDAQMLQYLTENPLDEFPLAAKLFNEFKNKSHKLDFFRYYFLYINGGCHIHFSVMIRVDIATAIKDYDFVSIKSGGYDSLFTGVIACAPKNKLARDLLKILYEITVEEMAANDYYITSCKKMHLCVKENTHNLKIKLYKEAFDKRGKYADAIDDDGTKLFSHYFAWQRIPRKVVKPTCVSDTKIAITFDVPNQPVDMFSNGIKQNTVFFYELLVNIGYDVYMIVSDGAKYETSQKPSFWNYCNIKYLKNSDILTVGFNVVVQFGYQQHGDVLEQLQKCGARTVFYNCGNKYLIESEICLFKPTATVTYQYNDDCNTHHFDEIWLIPQMTNTCLHYMKTLYRSNAFEVPFIWSPAIIENYEEEYFKQFSKKLSYVNKGASKKCAIFEPNLSIMKWAFPSVLICENAYRGLSDKELIKSLYVTNVDSVEKKDQTFNLKAFNAMVKSLDLFADKKISIESRYVAIFFMSKHADIAISHQLENPLNYLYFDLAWMGWPIVHNASLCKDVGYYYEGFNFEIGGEMVKNAILTHDDNVEEYTKRNRSVIGKYLPSNKYLQEQYRTLVSKLLR